MLVTDKVKALEATVAQLIKQVTELQKTVEELRQITSPQQVYEARNSYLFECDE